MKNFDDVFTELLNDHRKVEVCEVTKTLIATMNLLDKESGNFAKVRLADEKAYNGLMNTLTFSIFSNLVIIGKSKDEIEKFFSEFDDEHVTSMAMAVVEEKEEEGKTHD